MRGPVAVIISVYFTPFLFFWFCFVFLFQFFQGPLCPTKSYHDIQLEKETKKRLLICAADL